MRTACRGLANAAYKSFDECMRVLEDGGSIIFKWDDTHITVNEILKIIGVNPIIGHKSGRLNNTHWMLFVKGASYIGDNTR